MWVRRFLLSQTIFYEKLLKFSGNLPSIDLRSNIHQSRPNKLKQTKFNRNSESYLEAFRDMSSKQVIDGVGLEQN